MKESMRRSRNNRIRRNRQLRRRMTLGAVTVFLALLLSLTMGASLSSAQEENKQISYKYFKSIMIESGDTLTDIANMYLDEHYDSVQEYIDEVASINHLHNTDKIISGRYLIVPYYSTQLK